MKPQATYKGDAWLRRDQVVKTPMLLHLATTAYVSPLESSTEQNPRRKALGAEGGVT